MLDGYVSFSRNPSDHVLPLTLDGPVDAALGLLRYRFKERRVNLHREVEPSLPLVRGNSATLQQVMVNLLVNSLDALSTRTLAETRHIWIKVQRSSDGTQVEAFFADNGTGICPENAPHVFDYFFTTKAEEEGTGLGLPIASKILEAHGGHLTLVEFPAFGKDWNPKPVTTFKMALPALQSSR